MNRVRESILNRLPKDNFSRNSESKDLDFEKEQQRLAAKKARLASIQEHRKLQFFGSSQDKQGFRSTMNQQQFMHQQLQSKIKDDQSVRNRQAELNQEQVQRQRHEEQVKRQNDLREQAKQTLKENQLLSEEKKNRKQQERFENIQADLKMIQHDPFKMGSNAL